MFAQVEPLEVPLEVPGSTVVVDEHADEKTTIDARAMVRVTGTSGVSAILPESGHAELLEK
jgi:hypothetical protein